jgi:hypothetical protein
VIVTVLQLIPWWLATRDFEALQFNGKPRFAAEAPPPSDGGSLRYRGFGYTLWNLHRLTNFGGGRHGVLVGPKLEYWVPLGLTKNREHIKVVDQNGESGPEPLRNSQPSED